MYTFRVALYQLVEQDGQLYDQKQQLFDSHSFSKYKYGSTKISKQYGIQLLELIQNKLPLLLEESGILLSASPYKYVPDPSKSIAVELFQLWKDKLPFSYPQWIKISRANLFPIDYSELDLQSRQKLMQQTDLYWVTPIASGIKKIIVIGDLMVSGVQESRLSSFLEEEGFQEIYFIYIAEIKQFTHPTIEFTINQQAISQIEDLIKIWKIEGFTLNSKICKYLLSFPDQKKLTSFVHHLPEEWSRKIAEGMRLDGYSGMKEYRDNWSIWAPYANLVNEAFEEKIP